MPNKTPITFTKVCKNTGITLKIVNNLISAFAFKTPSFEEFLSFPL